MEGSRETPARSSGQTQPKNSSRPSGSARQAPGAAVPGPLSTIPLPVQDPKPKGRENPSQLDNAYQQPVKGHITMCAHAPLLEKASNHRVALLVITS